jgi:hypothetical protein
MKDLTAVVAGALAIELKRLKNKGYTDSEEEAMDYRDLSCLAVYGGPIQMHEFLREGNAEAARKLRA